MVLCMRVLCLRDESIQSILIRTWGSEEAKVKLFSIMHIACHVVYVVPDNAMHHSAAPTAQ